MIQGDLYGSGPRGVVLAHGGRFNKGSWEKQARELATAGYRVLAIDFRGYGESTGPGQSDIFTAPLYLDVLAGVRHLRATGATTVAAIGGSLGGSVAADAAIAEPGAIDRLILLGSTPDAPPEKLVVRKLYIATRDDTSGDGPRLPGLQAHFAAAPEPKDAHPARGLGARAVHVPDRPGRPRDARDPSLPRRREAPLQQSRWREGATTRSPFVDVAPGQDPATDQHEPQHRRPPGPRRSSRSAHVTTAGQRAQASDDPGRRRQEVRGKHVAIGLGVTRGDQHDRHQRRDRRQSGPSHARRAPRVRAWPAAPPAMATRLHGAAYHSTRPAYHSTLPALSSGAGSVVVVLPSSAMRAPR